jgi:hypothetical protein
MVVVIYFVLILVSFDSTGYTGIHIILYPKVLGRKLAGKTFFSYLKLTKYKNK